MKNLISVVVVIVLALLVYLMIPTGEELYKESNLIKQSYNNIGSVEAYGKEIEVLNTSIALENAFLFPVAYTGGLVQPIEERRPPLLGNHNGADWGPTWGDNPVNRLYGTDSSDWDDYTEDCIIVAPISGVMTYGTNFLGGEYKSATGGMGYYASIYNESDGSRHLLGHMWPFEGEAENYVNFKKVEINKGDPIAYMGSTGGSTGVHLHYEIRDRYNNSISVYTGEKVGDSNTANSNLRYKYYFDKSISELVVAMYDSSSSVNSTFNLMSKGNVTEGVDGYVPLITPRNQGH